MLNLAKIAGFSPTELQGAVLKGVFPQKARWNHPNLPTSAKKGWEKAVLFTSPAR